jgi:hypothetical protein
LLGAIGTGLTLEICLVAVQVLTARIDMERFDYTMATDAKVLTWAFGMADAVIQKLADG